MVMQKAWKNQTHKYQHSLSSYSGVSHTCSAVNKVPAVYDGAIVLVGDLKGYMQCVYMDCNRALEEVGFSCSMCWHDPMLAMLKWVTGGLGLSTPVILSPARHSE